MSRAAVSILVFGGYLATAGVLLLAVPEQVCRLLAMAPPQGGWIRINGMFFLILAAYCWRAGVEQNQGFMRWTVGVRLTPILFLTWFVLAGWIEPVVLLFGAVDVGGAMWTAVALRQDDVRAAAGGWYPNRGVAEGPIGERR